MGNSTLATLVGAQMALSRAWARYRQSRRASPREWTRWDFLCVQDVEMWVRRVRILRESPRDVRRLAARR